MLSHIMGSDIAVSKSNRQYILDGSSDCIGELGSYLHQQFQLDKLHCRQISVLRCIQDFNYSFMLD
jgi:hypothetical protein